MELLKELFYGLLNTLVLNGVSCLVFLRIDLKSLNAVEVLGKSCVVLAALKSVECICFIDNVIGVVLERYVGEVEVILLAVPGQRDSDSVR